MEWLMIFSVLMGTVCGFPAYHEYQYDPALGYINPNYWSAGKVLLSSDPTRDSSPQSSVPLYASYDDTAKADEGLPAPTEEQGPDSSEPEEPVFSDVSNLEPVYSFQSRSRYQRGRAVFAETTYIPAEPPAPPMAQQVHTVPAKQQATV